MELIKIIEREGRQLVSGRELDEFLEIKTKYKDWSLKMVEYGFDEEIDFIRVAQKRATNNLKNPVTTVICEKKLKEVKKLSPMELMELQFRTLKKQEEKIAQVENKVDNLKEDMPLFQMDYKEIQALVRKKGIEALGGYRSIAYNDNSVRGKKEIISKYKVTLVLENEIKLLNVEE